MTKVFIIRTTFVTMEVKHTEANEEVEGGGGGAGVSQEDVSLLMTRTNNV